MYKEVILQTTEGEKAFPMLANGATNVRYRQVFHSDLMIGITKYAAMSSHPDLVDGELAAKLAYIMNSAAMGLDMNTLSEDGYLQWLEQFEGAAIWLANDDILEVYMGNQKTESHEKNAPAPPTER